MLKREKGGKVGLSILQTHLKKAGLTMVPHPGELSIQFLKDQVFQAHKQFHHLKKDDMRRDTWIAQLIAAQSAVWNCSKKALWKQLHSTERIRKTAQIVQQILKPTGASHPLLMVMAPDDQTSARQERTQKTELEQACLVETRRRFTQACHTPLLSTPLLDLFGKCGQTKAFQQVLISTFLPPPDCD